MYAATELWTSDNKSVSLLGKVIYTSIWFMVLLAACIGFLGFLLIRLVKSFNKKQEVTQ